MNKEQLAARRRAMEAERDGYKQSGRKDRVEDLNKAIAALDEDGDDKPKERSAPKKATTVKAETLRAD
jgi:hypothetical protein